MRDIQLYRNMKAMPLQHNRSDRTPLGLFLAGLRGWEAGLRRYIPGKSEGK